jgi:3-phosphoshikimate 1-carboxyvinyltransferase
MRSLNQLLFYWLYSYNKSNFKLPAFVSCDDKKCFHIPVFSRTNSEALNTRLYIKRTTVLNGTAAFLPASKSISNRALIINALSGSKAVLDNLSDANDTQLMLRLVNSDSETIDVEDAGTTMRFLTAYFAVTGKQKTLTGTHRMKERPIGLLVDALRSLGCEIKYLEKDGFPSHQTLSFSGQKTNMLEIRGDVSSQYISALMMIAPILPDGLQLKLTGKIGSRPYIEMTAALMRQFGAELSFRNDTIVVQSKKYKPSSLSVESDWSAVSYWFAFTALADKAEIFLPRLQHESLQGDSVITDIALKLGVKSVFENGLLKLTKVKEATSISWDFTHCPDLAQTVAVICAAKGITGKFIGLESLRIKETDRIAALQNELRKIGADLTEEKDEWTLIPTKKLPVKASFETYKDHRMAMAFAPLATLMEVEIDNADVVRKSYPNFWRDMESFGFQIIKN